VTAVTVTRHTDDSDCVSDNYCDTDSINDSESDTDSDSDETRRSSYGCK